MDRSAPTPCGRRRSALRAWAVDGRLNRAGEGDDDPKTVAPLAEAG